MKKIKFEMNEIAMECVAFDLVRWTHEDQSTQIQQKN